MPCFLAFLVAALPAFPQDSEVDRLRKEIEQLKAQLKEREAVRALTVPVPVPRVTLPATPEAPMPRLAAPVQGKVSAVANEIGLLVVSVGKDDGVRDGDEFTVYRSGEFVAKISIDRADRKWSAGKVVMKKSEPRVGDDARIQTTYYSFTAPSMVAVPDSVPPKSADSLRDIRKELDEIRQQVRALSDQLVPSWSGVGVAVEEASADLKAHLGVERGLVVRRVREGSPAEKAGLRIHDFLPRLDEAQLVMVLEKGLPVDILRQGKTETLRRR